GFRGGGGPGCQGWMVSFLVSGEQEVNPGNPGGRNPFNAGGSHRGRHRSSSQGWKQHPTGTPTSAWQGDQHGSGIYKSR
ncbi:unnamed protein product, partial [Discosporangium mesarthrocarpum]